MGMGGGDKRTLAKECVISSVATNQSTVIKLVMLAVCLCYITP